MKKLLAVLVVAVFAPCVFAAPNPAAALNKAVEQAAVKATASHENKIAQTKASLLSSLQYFTRFAYSCEYSDYSYLFQALDGVREDYIALRTLSLDAAREMAHKVNEPIAINKGSRTIRIADYVRMETCVLGSYSQREADLWYTWSRMLEDDLKAVPVKKGAVTADTPLQAGLPKDFAYGVKGFRAYVGDAPAMNANWVLQSMMTAMDAFNAHKDNPAVAKAMAAEFVKPVQSGWGPVIYPQTFIINHACELYGPVQNDLMEFVSELDKWTR